MFMDFINDKLSPDDLEEFLDHVNNCDECKQELDIYYTVTKGMQLLDEHPDTKKIYINIDDKLASADEWLASYRLRKMEKISILILLCLFMIFL